MRKKKKKPTDTREIAIKMLVDLIVGLILIIIEKIMN